jgi:hypothetical protein
MAILCRVFPGFADDAEDRAVATVTNLGGSVVGDDTDPTRPVVEIRLTKSKVTDSDLKQLAVLEGPGSVRLNRKMIIDMALKELAALKNLKELYLYSASPARRHALAD